jgi:uncharacterized protein (TIGR03435 family)
LQQVIRMKRILAIHLFPLALAFAQPATTASFDAASIKPSPPDADETSWHSRVGSVNIRNYTLKGLIQLAYHLQEYRVSGGPKWVDSEHFDIIARAASAAKGPELLAMVRTLLTDRFQLAFHKESKLVPGYSLLVAKKGLKIVPVEAKGQTGTSWGSGGFKATQITMPALAESLAGILHAPVMDMTEVQGAFNVKLEWTPDSSSSDGADSKPDRASSVFTAMQEPLGLRLEAGKTPVDVYVIDRAQRPSEN